MLAFHLMVLHHWHHSHSPASYGVNFCVSFRFQCQHFQCYLILDQAIVIPRDREVRESARKGPHDEEALCCSLACCLVFLASPTVAHITYFIIQLNSNKNNKQALQYSANNFTIKDQELITTEYFILKQFALKHIFVYNIALWLSW